MKNSSISFHGSDYDTITAQFHISTTSFLRFSDNINPLGLSSKLKQKLVQQIDCIHSYPDRSYHSLCAAIADYTHMPQEDIFIGSGSNELISLFLRTIQPKKALLLAPTYSEYEKELALLSCHCYSYFLDAKQNFVLDISHFLKQLTDDLDVVFLCNPNNPTASFLDIKQIEQIVATCSRKNIFILIDETYLEFLEQAPFQTAIPLTQTYANLIVLRGCSKFFAAPGLRLNYAILHNNACKEQMLVLQNPWSVNSFAADCADVMFSDQDYITQTRDFITNERARVMHCLAPLHALHVFPSVANFILVKWEQQTASFAAFFKHIIQSGCMIRNCSSFPSLEEGFFRFCLLTRTENDFLIEQFKKYL